MTLTLKYVHLLIDPSIHCHGASLWQHCTVRLVFRSIEKNIFIAGMRRYVGTIYHKRKYNHRGISKSSFVSPSIRRNSYCQVNLSYFLGLECFHLEVGNFFLFVFFFFFFFFFFHPYPPFRLNSSLLNVFLSLFFHYYCHLYTNIPNK